MTIEASARAELTPPREEARNFSGAANLWKYRKQRFKDGDEDGSPTRRFIQRFVVGILPKHSDFACFPLPLFYELFIYVGYFFNSITSFDSFSLSRFLAFGQLLHEHRRNWRAGDKTRRWKRLISDRFIDCTGANECISWKIGRERKNLDGIGR